MIFTVEVLNKGKIGFQKVNGYVDGDSITFPTISVGDGVRDSNGNHVWSVGTSTCLPTNPDEAQTYISCYQAVMNVLKTLQL